MSVLKTSTETCQFVDISKGIFGGNIGLKKKSNKRAPGEPERIKGDILLMPPFYDTSSWYHDVIG